MRISCTKLIRKVARGVCAFMGAGNRGDLSSKGKGSIESIFQNKNNFKSTRKIPNYGPLLPENAVELDLAQPWDFDAITRKLYALAARENSEESSQVLDTSSEE